MDGRGTTWDKVDFVNKMYYNQPMTTITLKRKKDLMKTKILISQAVGEVLADPDFGLELTEYMKKRLEKAKKYKGKLIPFSEIKKRYL